MDNCLDIFGDYVKFLGEKLKIEGLSLDENNDCYIAFDGKYFVKCSVDAEKKQIIFLAYIGALPEDNEIYYNGILDSCYFWKDTAGSNISLDREDGTLLLTQFCDMEMMSQDEFFKVIENFVNAMEHWDTKRRDEWMNGISEDGSIGGSEVAESVPGTPNMMMFGA